MKGEMNLECTSQKGKRHDSQEFFFTSKTTKNNKQQRKAAQFDLTTPE